MIDMSNIIKVNDCQIPTITKIEANRISTNYRMVIIRELSVHQDVSARHDVVLVSKNIV